MRGAAVVMVGAALLAGCDGAAKKERKAEQAAAAAHYVPPTELSRAEYGGIVERRFHRLDANGDNKLTPDELPPRLAAHLKAMDLDGDGAVSAEEFGQAMDKRFDRNDLNGDGTVTSAEREAAKAGAKPPPKAHAPGTPEPGAAPAT